MFGFPLDDVQLEAIQVLQQDQSLVISAPTGAGKTAIALAGTVAALSRCASLTIPLGSWLGGFLVGAANRQRRGVHGSRDMQDMGFDRGDVTAQCPQILECTGPTLVPQQGNPRPPRQNKKLHWSHVPSGGHCFLRLVTALTCLAPCASWLLTGGAGAAGASA